MNPPPYLTWEQFAPPYKEVPSVMFPRQFAKNMQQIAPVGDGKPLSDSRYRVHEGCFSDDDEKHAALVDRHEHAVVITFEGQTVGVLSGTSLWVHEEHRRNQTKTDVAAELWVEHARVRDWRAFTQHYAKAGKPVPMVRSTIKVGLRAYKLCIERGYVVAPPGYVVPEI